MFIGYRGHQGGWTCCFGGGKSCPKSLGQIREVVFQEQNGILIGGKLVRLTDHENDLKATED